MLNRLKGNRNHPNDGQYDDGYVDDVEPATAPGPGAYTQHSGNNISPGFHDRLHKHDAGAVGGHHTGPDGLGDDSMPASDRHHEPGMTRRGGRDFDEAGGYQDDGAHSGSGWRGGLATSSNVPKPLPEHRGDQGLRHERGAYTGGAGDIGASPDTMDDRNIGDRHNRHHDRHDVAGTGTGTGVGVTSNDTTAGFGVGAGAGVGAGSGRGATTADQSVSKAKTEGRIGKLEAGVGRLFHATGMEARGEEKIMNAEQTIARAEHLKTAEHHDEQARLALARADGLDSNAQPRGNMA